MDLEKEKKWYTDAVRSFLILNYGMASEVADEAMTRYMLKEKLDEFPEIQLHYSIESAIWEMENQGCIPKSTFA